jgi:3-oxoadipate enol-lactonase
MPETTAAGVRLNYVDTKGEGMPLLLLHAFPMSARMWEPQLDALGDRWRVIAPDLKGFGASDAPDDRAAYSMESYAAEVEGLLDNVGLETAVIAGLSMGGYIAMALLRRNPRLFRGLVLADTRAEADPPEGVARRTEQQQLVESGRISEVGEMIIGALLSPTSRSARPDVVEKVRSLMDNPPQAYIGALEAMKKRPDSTSDLDSVQVPSLVMVGEDDALTPPDAARTMHERIKGSRLVTLPEAGHLSNLEAPEAFNGALAELLQTIP